MCLIELNFEQDDDELTQLTIENLNLQKTVKQLRESTKRYESEKGLYEKKYKALKQESDKNHRVFKKSHSELEAVKAEYAKLDKEYKKLKNSEIGSSSDSLTLQKYKELEDNFIKTKT